MTDDENTRIRGLVTEATGEVVAAITAAPWGSKNRSWIAELGSGSHVVIQVFADRDGALRRFAAADRLGPFLSHPLPRLRAHGQIAERTWTVTDLLPGEPGYVAANWNLSAPGWPRMAAEMGRCIAEFQRVPLASAGLPTTWAVPAELRSSAVRWLDHLEPHLDGATLVALDGTIADTTADDETAVVCHGDFGPQNVLFEGTTVSGILDLEDARIADPYLDVAWWNWVVRTHTPDAFDRSWASFVGETGLPARPGDRRLAARLRRLIVLRLLETAEHFRRLRPEKHAGWAHRVRVELSVPLERLLV